MKAISEKIGGFMSEGSWIRKMFEDGATLKAQYGKDNVYDFSLGNPMGEPPDDFLKAIEDALRDPSPGLHGYMPNAGYPSVRSVLAETLSEVHQRHITSKHIIMTVGAAGALNVVLKAVLNPGETVLVFAPYFVEYRFYIDNAGGRTRIVETDERFDLDIDACEKAMDSSVKAVIINTPNNPTGKIYAKETLKRLGKLLEKKSAEYGHPIYILSDEPYRRIYYGNEPPVSSLTASRFTIICTSYSKELSIPGERLGYILVHPDCPDVDILMDALTFCNRILGFVNAPALMQRALALAPRSVVDIEPYRENRDLLVTALAEMGLDIVPPAGAFYLFPKSPVPDEMLFVSALKEERILVVPGRGFGRSGYFRISYCVRKDVIERALPGFRRVMDRF